jgi:hypothetical protein
LARYALPVRLFIRDFTPVYPGALELASKTRVNPVRNDY